MPVVCLIHSAWSLGVASFVAPCSRFCWQGCPKPYKSYSVLCFCCLCYCDVFIVAVIVTVMILPVGVGTMFMMFIHSPPHVTKA